MSTDTALKQAILAVRKGGRVSIPGVYGGMTAKFPIGADVLESGWRTVRPAAPPNWQTCLTVRISAFS